MNKKDFYFELPKELIAQHPLTNRRDSRLLHYNLHTKLESHYQFKHLINFFNKGDLLVFNNSKVIPARLYALKMSGGKAELLIERILEDQVILAHIKCSKAPKPGTIFYLDNNWRIEVIDKRDSLYLCQVSGLAYDMLTQIGKIPLPPYITRPQEETDLNRYQTIYGEHLGSIAAATAGLHFDEDMFRELRLKGVQIGYLTLHVGAGTFQPVRSEMITDHKMHSERLIVDEELSEKVLATQKAGKRVIAVGTTALRGLESAASNRILKSCTRDTSIFIYPGYQFQICNGLITNFHLPESTLIMLVAALIGHKEVMRIYQEAIKLRYRFFSYGDVSLLL